MTPDILIALSGAVIPVKLWLIRQAQQKQGDQTAARNLAGTGKHGKAARKGKPPQRAGDDLFL